MQSSPRAQIAKGINDDGQWYEGAWGYHFYTMSAIAPLAEAGERCGLKLYAFEEAGHSYRKLFEGPLDLAMPNFVLPAFNDSGQVNVGGQQGLYELALARYGDPRFAEVAGAGKRDSLQALLVGVFPPPASAPRTSASRNFTGAGYAILQQGPAAGPGADATWLCLKYGPHGGGHGHPDKLNFILYSRGQVLGYDPGTGRYGVPLHEGWQKTTIAHNTLTVDEANQKPATGKCLAFVAKPDWAAALADAGPIYPGVSYQRAVALAGPDLVLVLDMVQAEQEHVFDLAYHDAGKWATAPTGPAVTPPGAGAGAAKPGYEYLKDMVQVTAPLPAIAQDPVRVGIAVAVLPGAGQRAEVWAGAGAGASTAERVPCVIVRTHGKQALVAWALHLNGATPTVTVAQRPGQFIAEAQVNGQTRRLIVLPGAGAGADAAVKVE